MIQLLLYSLIEVTSISTVDESFKVSVRVVLPAPVIAPLVTGFPVPPSRKTVETPPDGAVTVPRPKIESGYTCTNR